VSLVLIAVGRLYSYQGSRIVIQGADQGFCNTVSAYDSWHPGRFAAEGKVSPAPFCIDELTSFTASYTTDNEPTHFAADVLYRRSLDAPAEHKRITVNHPLRLSGDRIYLIGHGYAPRITVHMPDGSTRTDTAAFLPQDATTFLSEGAFKEAAAPGAKKDIGIAGFFAPTPADTGGGVITSVAPQADHPILGIFVYQGDLNYNGLPQNVYTLDTSKMTQLGAANLQTGQTAKFGNGVSVTFDGWVPYASIQVSHDPSQGWLLWSALAMVLGLLCSLGIRRRRVWLRITPSRAGGAPSHTVVAGGGLARSDSGNFRTEFEHLLARLRRAAAPSKPLVGAGRE
jgi:cytochrome c biogenesis protein